MAGVDGLGIPGITEPVRVGQGGFGTVYRASQPAYRRTVAVKVMSGPMLDDEGQRAFERECQALGSLSSHPNIVSLYAAGISEFERPYMIMDYLPGGSLGDRIATNPLGWQEAVEIGVKVSGALATAHAAGVLHRDVKPENILLSAYGEPQLADFGVARLQGGTRTATGTITGSLAHAAPEVLSGVSATEASDVWSLASTVATLILGRPPFHKDGETSLHPLITRILTGPPTDLRPLGVPDVVCEAIESALVKDSWDRTPTATAFGESLQAAQRALGIPVTSLPAPRAPGAELAPPEPFDQAPPATPSSPPVVPAPAAGSGEVAQVPSRPVAGSGEVGQARPSPPAEEESTRYRFVRPDGPAESDPELATRRRGSLPEVPVVARAPETAGGPGPTAGAPPPAPAPSGTAGPAAGGSGPTPAVAGSAPAADLGPAVPAVRAAPGGSGPPPAAGAGAAPPPAGVGPSAAATDEALVTRYGRVPIPPPVDTPEGGDEDVTRRRMSVDSLAPAPPVAPRPETGPVVIAPAPDLTGPAAAPGGPGAGGPAEPTGSEPPRPPTAPTTPAVPPSPEPRSPAPPPAGPGPGPVAAAVTPPVPVDPGPPPVQARPLYTPIPVAEPAGRGPADGRRRPPVAVLLGAGAAVVVIIVAVVVAMAGGGKSGSAHAHSGTTVPTTLTASTLAPTTVAVPTTSSSLPPTTAPPARTTVVTPAPTTPATAPPATTPGTFPVTAPPATTPPTSPPTAPPTTAPQETTTVCIVKNGKRVCFVP